MLREHLLGLSFESNRQTTKRNTGINFKWIFRNDLLSISWQSVFKVINEKRHQDICKSYKCLSNDNTCVLNVNVCGKIPWMNQSILVSFMKNIMNTTKLLQLSNNIYHSTLLTLFSWVNVGKHSYCFSDPKIIGTFIDTLFAFQMCAF